MLQAADFLSSWTRVPNMWHASLRAPYKPPFLSSESPSCEPLTRTLLKMRTSARLLISPCSLFNKTGLPALPRLGVPVRTNERVATCIDSKVIVVRLLRFDSAEGEGTSAVHQAANTSDGHWGGWGRLTESSKSDLKTISQIRFKYLSVQTHTHQHTLLAFT